MIRLRAFLLFVVSFAINAISLAIGAENAQVLTVPQQKLQAKITPAGFGLVSTSRGYEDFSVTPIALRRLGKSAGECRSAVDRIYSINASASSCAKVTLHRGMLDEQVMVTPDGLRQDFIIHQRPAGAGALHLTLATQGVQIEQTGGSVALSLFRSGRRLVYDRLCVLDAAGTKLPAHFETYKNQIRIVVSDEQAVYPVCIDPTYSDEDWRAIGGRPGPNSHVYAFETNIDGNLIAGGTFTSIASQPISGLATWDGDSWTALGGGVSGSIGAMVWHQGSLIVAGKFTHAGSVPANNIARWDGTQWHALGAGTDNEVSALTSDGTVLYAGGLFNNAGGTSAVKVAKWDGTEWSALGTGITGYVSSLAVFNNALYVGGSFTKAGSLNCNNFARWTGTAWNSFSLSSRVNVLKVVGNQLYVGGFFQEFGGAKYIGRWNGVNLSALGAGLASEVYSLGEHNGDLIVGYDYNVVKWSGGVWTALGERLTRQVRAIRTYNNGLFIGGEFSGTDSDTYAAAVARLENSKWKPVGQYAPGLIDIVQKMAVWQDKLYLAGTLQVNGQPTIRHLVCWDGDEWSSVGSGINGRVLSIVAGTNALYISGEMTQAGGVTVSKIAKWNGTTWSGFSPAPPTNIGALHVTDSNVLLAAGTSSSIYVYRWTGYNWETVGNRLWSGTVTTMTSSGSTLYIGGTFKKNQTYVSTNGIAKVGYMGTGNWEAFGEGIVGDVMALEVRGNEVYAGGVFTQADNVYSPALARWDGTKWNQVGGEFSQYAEVRALKFVGTDLYAAGSFTGTTTVSARNIAKWDGSQWHPLGAGVNSRVFALVQKGTDLYVTGSFGKAGNTDCNGLAALNTLGGPEIQVSGMGTSIPSGTTVPSLSSGTDFGGANPVSGNVRRSFSLLNQGGRPLNITSLSLVAIANSDPASFRVTTDVGASLAVGATATFEITFDPATTGTFVADVQVQSDALNTPTYTFRIEGKGLSQQQVFESEVAEAGLVGEDARESATPFNDGVTNLGKYAFGMNLAKADSRTFSAGSEEGGLPLVTFVTEGIRIEYLRRRGGDLHYEPMMTATLEQPSWEPAAGAVEVLRLNDLWERVVHTVSHAPAALPERYFVKVRVGWQ